MVIKMPEEYKGRSNVDNVYTKTKPRRWTEDEVKWCLKLREDGLSIREIAESVDRSEVSVGIKLKRLTKKTNTYNEKHVLEKYAVNKEFVEYINPETILDVYCGENSYYKKNFQHIKTITNDINNDITADYNLDSLKLLCLMHYEGKTFDMVDLDPFGSASECFDLAIKLSNKALVITLGEVGHKRWKRLDYVNRHYGIDDLENFTTENLIAHIVEMGKKHKKLLVPYVYKDWKQISRVWFEIKPYKITEQWDKSDT